MTALLPVLVALATFAVATTLLSRRRGRALARRIAPHVERPQAAPLEAERREGTIRGLLAAPLGATERRLAGTRLWRRLERLSARAALPLRPVELLYAACLTALAPALVAVALGASPAGAATVFLLVLVAVRAGLALRSSRRTRAFESQLPELLGSLASALRAGHSFLQALQAIAAEAPEPAASELRRVLTEARLGRPLERALGDLGERIDSQELRFALDAVVIQRQVGGSLAGIFELVADALRQRQQFLLKVRALTAMGRTSSTVLLGLPLFVGGLLTALNPDYMQPLYATSTGHLMLVAAVALMGVGALWLRRIVVFRG